MSIYSDLIDRLKCFDRQTCDEAARVIECQNKAIDALQNALYQERILCLKLEQDHNSNGAIEQQQRLFWDSCKIHGKVGEVIYLTYKNKLAQLPKK